MSLQVMSLVLSVIRIVIASIVVVSTASWRHVKLTKCGGAADLDWNKEARENWK
jgi:hypothetical protein